MFPHFSRSITTELQPFQVSSQPPLRSDTSSQCLRWEATVGLWSWDCLRMTQVNSPCFKGPKGGNLETHYNLDLRLGWTFSLCCTRCTCMKHIIIGPAHSEKEWFKCGPSKKHHITSWFDSGIMEKVWSMSGNLMLQLCCGNIVWAPPRLKQQPQGADWSPVLELLFGLAFVGPKVKCIYAYNFNI